MERMIRFGNNQLSKFMNDNILEMTVSITAKGAKSALEFYEKAFGAKVGERMVSAEGVLEHADFTVGKTKMHISDEEKSYNAFGMKEGQLASCLFFFEVKDCDTAFNKAVEAGAEVLKEPSDEPWGGRHGMVKDAWGYRWSFAHMLKK